MFPLLGKGKKKEKKKTYTCKRKKTLLMKSECMILIFTFTFTCICAWLRLKRAISAWSLAPPLHNVLQSINIDSMEVGWFVGWLARLPGTWVHDEGRIWEEINQLFDGLHNRSHTYCSLVHNWVPKVLHQCTVSDFAEGLGLWSMSRCGHRWRIYAGNAYQIKWPV